MQTENLIDQAKQSMRRYACRDLSGEEKMNMQNLVERFFDERAGELNEADIMAHMATPMQALAWFHPFLCQTYRDRCCSDAMPQGTDTCDLA